MSKRFEGIVNVDIRESVPDWSPFEAPVAPDEAPNVVYIVLDDVGFSALGSYGGPVETPNIDRIVDDGLRYTQMHTTALCSPTRSCLLTGRNHTRNSMACITEAAIGFPNASGVIPPENGQIQEILAARGWNTYMVGKWHLCPDAEMNLASSRRNWPTGRGFERFYGFLGAETNQWYPDLVHDNHPVDQPSTPEEGYHLTEDITDKALEFIKDAKVVAPQKPFFLYYAPGACHAPHHAPKEWIEKFKGRFDMGYEEMREQTLARQKQMGIVPGTTQLPPINPIGTPDSRTGPDGKPFPALDYTRPWDSLSTDEQRLFCRMAEVYAGFLAHADDQIGRLLDYLEETGQRENTLVVVISDNGASGEGGPNGSVNEGKFFNGYIDTVEESMKFFDRLGGPETYNHYPIGWAMAFNTPYKLYKRYASHEGGIADTAIISWPNGIAAHGEVRDNYVNVCDITPTVYDLLGITPPETVNGIRQKPLDGMSFKAALADPNADTGKTTQFYTMLGTRGIWHNGWFANTIHAATPAGWSHFDKDRWELFHIEADRSQCHDLAAEQPEKLEELKALWFSEATKYNGLPLADLNIFETLMRFRPYLSLNRQSFTYYPDAAEVGIGAAVEPRGQSYSVVADVTVDTTGAEGVLYKQGCAHGGHVLFIQDGRLHYVYNFLGEREQLISSSGAVPLGRHLLGVRFSRTGTVENSHTPLGEATLFIDETAVASLPDMTTQPGPFGLAGASVMVGRNTGSEVSRRYKAPFRFTGGAIAQVTVDISGRPYEDLERELALAFSRD